MRAVKDSLAAPYQARDEIERGQLGISQTTPLRRIYENEPSVPFPSIRGALEEIRGGKRRRKNEME